ncbi:MAG: insulinase family protein [Candidatus Algichlamydia australiensis]|nr:insulinase family protein [Chlamydiales bacterium]
MVKNLLGTLIISSSFAAAPFQNIADQNTLKIETPSLQERKTAKIRLDNGLEAYLISDPKTDKSGAALGVNAGSWHNPKEYPGMAHFLEHMLFLGTEAFPDEADFSTYIANHGGKNNAYTAAELTLYYFCINNRNLPGAIERFSQFFHAPLFKQSGMGRELKAVNQEHEKSKESDPWQWYLIFKETGNQNHPNRQYNCGTAETLGKIPPNELRAWFQNHYNANQMSLVVYSAMEMDELKKLVVANFSPIKNTALLAPDHVGKLTSSAQEGHITYIKPISDLRTLRLVWDLPADLSDDLENHTANFLAYILSTTTKGSLTSKLKQEELAEFIYADRDQETKDHSLFTINIDLTKYGISNADQAIERVFEMLASLKAEGIHPYLFDEMQKMSEIHYAHQSRMEAFDYVRKMTECLVNESVETFPQKSVRPTTYNAEKMQRLLDHLTPQTCAYYVIASPELTGVKPEKKEEWLGGEYTIKAIPSTLLAAWSKAEPNPSLHAPHANPYLPEHLHLVQSPKQETPTLLFNDAYGKIYYTSDGEYGVPESDYKFHFKSPEIDGSPRQMALLDLYSYAVTEELSHPLSYASAAGLYADISPQKLGLMVEISGYSEKAPLLLQEVTQKLKETTPSRDQFEIYRDVLLRTYSQKENDLLFRQSVEEMGSIVKNYAPNSRQKAQALKQISYEDFLSFNNKLFAQSYIEGTIVGNVKAETAQLIWQNLRNTITYTPYPKENQLSTKYLSLTGGKGPFIIKKQTPHKSNATILLVEQGRSTPQTRAAQLVLNSAMHQTFYENLRTKQQTGYIVKSWPEEISGQLVQSFCVQSTTHHPNELLSRYELFLESYVIDFETMFSYEQFEKIKTSLISQFKKPPTNLGAYADRMHNLAFNKNGDFAYKEKQIAALENLTYKELKDHALSFYSRKNRRRIALFYKGKVPRDQTFKYQMVNTPILKEIGTYVGKENSPIACDSTE